MWFKSGNLVGVNNKNLLVFARSIPTRGTPQGESSQFAWWPGFHNKILLIPCYLRIVMLEFQVMHDFIIKFGYEIANSGQDFTVRDFLPSLKPIAKILVVPNWGF